MQKKKASRSQWLWGFVSSSDIRDRGLIFSKIEAPYTTELNVRGEKATLVIETPILLSDVFAEASAAGEAYTLFPSDSRTNKVSTSADAMSVQNAKKAYPNSFPKKLNDYREDSLAITGYGSSLRIAKQSKTFKYDDLNGYSKNPKQRLFSQNDIQLPIDL